MYDACMPGLEGGYRSVVMMLMLIYPYLCTHCLLGFLCGLAVSRLELLVTGDRGITTYKTDK